MANTTITALPAATTPLAGTEVVPIVQGGVTKKVAVSNIGGGSGTVTSVSVATANGLAGSVATATTTPAITLSTTVTGILKGNGSAISAATANTDYQSPITLTTIGTSGVASFNGTTLNIPNYASGGGSGTVTSVAMSVPTFLSVAGSPITSSGTLAVTLSGTALPVANGGTGQTTANAALNGLLPSQSGQSGKVLSTNGTDTSWIATSGTGTVTSVALSAPAFLTVSGSPITASGTLALSYSGTAIPVANGGTGQTTATAAFDGLAPSQTGNSGKYLTTNGSTTSWATVSGTGTVTSVAQSFTGGIVSVAGSPITTSGTLALTVAGTSGGVPYFSGTNTWASSAVLTNNALMIGGGAGFAPATIATGTDVVGALGTNVGSAGAFVVNGGALGTPSGGTVTNLSGTASININGTVGASTPTTGIFTTATARSSAVQDFVALQGRAGGTNSYGVTLTPTTLTASRTLTLPDASGTILQSGTTVTVGQGGTGIQSGTSGGIPYFSSTSAVASSAALAANALVVGGGSGATPATVSNITSNNNYLQLGASTPLRFADADSSNYVSFQAPATVTSNVAWTLPATDGTSGQVLSTNGSGTLSWVTASASPTAPTSVEYLVIAGGGGGGGYTGGGGAGGLKTASSLSVSSGTSYTVTVGGGGPQGGSSGATGSQGTGSVFSSVSTTGGGGGGSVSTAAGNGGSGGGAGFSSINTPGTGVSGEGFAGGAGFNSGPTFGGGGGGSGGVGVAAANNAPGNGGPGTTYTSGTSITGLSASYAGGGGGGSDGTAFFGTGQAGGGNGGGSGAAGGTATANTGSGGGASGGTAFGTGAGGSGVVIIAYPDTFNNLSSIGAGLTTQSWNGSAWVNNSSGSTTPNTTIRSGYKVYRFSAGTGSIQW